MAVRNARPASLTAVSPQAFAGQAETRQNLEARSQIEALQKQGQPAGDTPPGTRLWLYRDEGTAGFYVTGSVSRTPGQADLDVPGMGFVVPPLYRAERLSVEVFLATTTSSGGAYLKVDLMGKIGKGSAEGVVASSRQVLPTLTNQAYFGNLLFDVKEAVLEPRIRVQIGGGTISIPAGAPTRQHWALYVPRKS